MTATQNTQPTLDDITRPAGRKAKALLAEYPVRWPEGAFDLLKRPDESTLGGPAWLIRCNEHGVVVGTDLNVRSATLLGRSALRRTWCDDCRLAAEAKALAADVKALVSETRKAKREAKAEQAAIAAVLGALSETASDDVLDEQERLRRAFNKAKRGPKADLLTWAVSECLLEGHSVAEVEALENGPKAALVDAIDGVLLHGEIAADIAATGR